MNRLGKKVAVITGGNSGIGLGIARSFMSEGAVGVISGRNQKNLDLAVNELNGGFAGYLADVTRIGDLENLFKFTHEQFGKIDTVVVNAGGAVEQESLIGSLATTEESNFDAYLNLNLKSVYFTVQKALPYMNDGGSVILIGSAAAHIAFQGMTIYGAAKAAVISLARGLSSDLLDRRIRVNALTPGAIDTPIFGKIVPADFVKQLRKIQTDSTPLGRIGQPADIGNAAVFLASDESAFVVGTELVSDGGVLNLYKSR